MLHNNPNWSEWDGGKVGGKPIWLNPATVPTIEQLTCAECTNPLSFLLQIYCPLDEEVDAFHRSLYVFCCRSAGCPKQGRGKVFRCQLPRENAFYAAESDAPPCERSDTGVSLCALCGQRAAFTCSACHVAEYCCKAHQKDHWNKGHKADCAKCLETQTLVESDETKDEIRTKGSKWVFPEYDMCIEHEPDSGEAVDEHERKLINEYEKSEMETILTNKSNTASTDGESNPFTDDSEIDISQKELNELTGAKSAQDKNYIRFLTRIALAKDQVLRYSRWQNDSVLWVHSEGALQQPGDIPNCPKCGGERAFEFQVLPQLLFYLQVDRSCTISEIKEQTCDWGTLVISTCTKSCPLEKAYVEEHLFYQEDPVPSTASSRRCLRPHAPAPAVAKMSSMRVRAQNKLLDKLGATKPSKNVQFDLAYAGFEKAYGGVESLDSALRGFIISLKAMHMSAQVLVSAIDNVAATQENTSEMKRYASDIKTAFGGLDVTFMADTVKRFEQRVLRPSNGWMGKANSLKQQVATFHDEKMVFDHYSRKVLTLREARDKRSGSGKPEKPKDVEKLVRASTR
ncbi:TPA: hypothetical protein N0F65_012833 [Lagenidium giganteum]|uniref:MYND-type domain-containing protein n=1 Tax=Lagenidium giganteum TaxID=4803 RepID=A0AAV2YH97_9STRA|nr:TPA: hypothetical protein N0F65_012833 [Lagenidium giganteum]